MTAFLLFAKESAMRWTWAFLTIALCSCAAPGSNLAKFYHGTVGAPHGREPVLTSTFLTEEMQENLGLRIIGAIAVTGRRIKQRDLVGFARRINAAVVTVRARPDGTYSYDVPEFKWVPGTTTRHDGTMTTTDGTTSYISGTSRTPGHLETGNRQVTRTRYAQAIVFWGY